MFRSSQVSILRHGFCVDFYVRLEASACLIDVLNEEVPGSFQWALNGGRREKAGDAAQVRLEAILTLSECGNGATKNGEVTLEAIQVLALSTEFEERSLADTVSAEHLEAVTALRALAANESLGLGIW